MARELPYDPIKITIYGEQKHLCLIKIKLFPVLTGNNTVFINFKDTSCYKITRNIQVILNPFG